ncbi:deoxyribonuclease-1-like [Odontesthes bonariensis]|uniref:deoxyribonuclease-1-like n=1 Tax=Odontesthes bonariensis TaxID=219752 RepID=UPI003F5867F3
MKVAAFNVKNLGLKKVKNKTVAKHLIKIISQYSVVVILEVMDKSGAVTELLLEKLNESQQHKYDKIASSQLGRNTYKERYVCFYRVNEVTLEKHMQYEDNQVGDEDAFAREPFILRFSCPTTVIKDLVLIPVHTKPEDSEKELDEIYDVVQHVIKEWGTENIMILGDFNADGRYLSKKKRESIRIFSYPFHWLIGDDVDTTASNYNDNTYDRIVVYGEAMLNAIVCGSAKSFNFQEGLRLTEKQALSISDHYPVEVELKADIPKKKRETSKTQTNTGGQGPKKSRPAGSQKEKVAAKGKQGPHAAAKTPTKRKRQ